MAHLIYGKDELLAAWAAKRMSHIGTQGFGPCKAVGVATGGTATDRLMAVCVYHAYNESYQTVQISMAACDPRWVSKATVRDLLSFPFLQYKVFKVYTVTPHESERTIRLNQRLGFTKEGVLRHQFGKGTHAVVCGMLWPEYKKKYLPNWDDGRSAIMNEMVH